jgi:heme oxygenase (biliverdin-IX-beta and delta-forming)
LKMPPLALELASHLRASSKAAHHNLDHHRVLAPLVAKTISVAQYGSALQALYGPQQALEKLIQPTLEALGQIQHFPPRAPDLLTDLIALGREPWPLQAAAPASLDRASVLGYWYVLEGSNLGGAVIAKQMAKSLPQAPMLFFTSAEGSPRWERFWGGVAAHYQAAELEKTVDAALCAFNLYQTHLDAFEQFQARSDQSPQV